MFITLMRIFINEILDMERLGVLRGDFCCAIRCLVTYDSPILSKTLKKNLSPVIFSETRWCIAFEKKHTNFEMNYYISSTIACKFRRHAIQKQSNLVRKYFQKVINFTILISIVINQ